jgi:hypothetical protein
MAWTRFEFRRRLAARTVALAIIAATGAALAPGTASAALDDANGIVTSDGLRIEARQSDTNIRFVAPMDGNPLTREWIHDGRAGFRIDGAGADGFAGKISIGYQVGYPATLSGQLRFSYTTPSLSLGIAGPAVGNLVPTVGVDIYSGIGPGIKTVEIVSAVVSGATGWVNIGGVHGSVTGVLGQTTIRPYVTVTSVHGDTVTTYGKDWKA